MSLKILKQQLKEIQAEDEEIVPVPRKEKKKLSLPEAKFTRQRKVMKKNMKPRGPVQVIEDEVSRVKEGGCGSRCLICRGKVCKGAKRAESSKKYEFH